MGEPHSVYSPDDGHLGSFHSLGIINEIAISTTQAFCMDRCLHFSWVDSMSGITDCANCIFNFIRKYKCPLCSPVFGIVVFLFFLTHSNGYVIIITVSFQFAIPW